MDRRLVGIWPGSNKFERQGFDLIRRAYVEARYSDYYEVSAEHLAWMDDRVATLQAVFETIARERIDLLKNAAA